MSIENSFCLCDWNHTVNLWKEAATEDAFAEAFFSSASTEEISFPDEIHIRLASWEILEEFGDWYRDRTFQPSADWDHFREACTMLGLMEKSDYEFEPINALRKEEHNEVVFGALPPESVKEVLEHLEKIDGAGLDSFFAAHDMISNVPFSRMVDEMKKALDPEKGLVIFAG